MCFHSSALLLHHTLSLPHPSITEQKEGVLTQSGWVGIAELRLKEYVCVWMLTEVMNVTPRGVGPAQCLWSSSIQRHVSPWPEWPVYLHIKSVRVKGASGVTAVDVHRPSLASPLQCNTIETKMMQECDQRKKNMRFWNKQNFVGYFLYKYFSENSHQHIVVTLLQSKRRNEMWLRNK